MAAISICFLIKKFLQAATSVSRKTLPKIYFLLFASARLTYLVIGSISDFGTLKEIV